VPLPPPPAPAALPAPFSQVGVASWYGPNFNRKPTAQGERYDMNALTAAHRTLPLNTLVRVTNLENGRTVIVRINDRGPYAGDRIIDLSAKAARELGMTKDGVARVRIEMAHSGEAAL
jgi:rare lipoprotein A